MITTASDAYDAQFRLYRQHAMNVPDTARHSAREVIFESYPMVGFNCRLTDIQAAVGREQLKRLPGVLERRRMMARRYAEHLAGVPGLTLPHEPAWARSNWQSYCVRLADRLDQVKVMQGMLDANIATRRGVMCSHREPAYSAGTWSCGPKQASCDCAAGQCKQLVESERATDHSVILPLYHQMTEADQDRVVAALRVACAG